MNDTDLQHALRALAESHGEAPLPAADVIWWRAELRRRLAAEERAVRPLRIVERLACAACLLAAVVLAAVKL